MRPPGCLLCVFAPLAAAPAAAQSPIWTVDTIEVASGAAALRIDGSEPSVLARDGRWWLIELRRDRITLRPRAAVPAEASAPDLIPSGRVVVGTGPIARAWLAGPTRRYPHGVLGDMVEAERLEIETAAGQRASFTLDQGSVFEDLAPRLADLDGDGREEILVVRSYLERGSALAVFRLMEERLVIIAETPAIGQPGRWLNPVGVGDFDGDGQREIAVVVTPHIDGTLRLYAMKGGKLTLEAQASGFSNHVIGSTALGLSAIVDVNGDGAAEIVLPDRSRKRLMSVSFTAGKLQIREVAAHASPIVTEIVPVAVAERVRLVYGHDSGSLSVVELPAGAVLAR